MSGIKYLDNILSFETVTKLSNIFATGGAIIATFLTLLGLIVTVIKFKNKKPFIGFIATLFTIALAISDFMILMYANDGRYSKQSWPNEENYTYFGTINNEKPHGWGKLFDSDGIVYYVGEFKNGQPDGKGKFYKKVPKSAKDDKDNVFAWKEGTFSQGKGEGHIIIRDMIEKKEVVIYDGDMINDEKCGQGTLYEYTDNYMWKSYKGAWAYDQKWGYGVDTEYDKSGNMKKRYKGTFINNEYMGKGVHEYSNNEESQVVMIGFWGNNSNDKNIPDSFSTSEFVYYHGEDKSLWEYIYGNDDELTEEELDYLQTLSEKWPCPEETIWDEP